MKFKDERIRGEFGGIEPQLRAILFELDHFCLANGMRQIFVTCLNRTPDENAVAKGSSNSFHMLIPCCAADIRAYTESWYSPDDRAAIIDYFQRHFGFREHDRIRPEPEKVHIHIQVQPGVVVWPKGYSQPS